VEVEDRLPGARADVDGEPVVLEAGALGGVRHELEHALRLLGRELADLLEARDVAFGQDEEVDVGLRVDVSDRYEPVARVDVVALLVELAEEAVVRQRGSPPR
jgi:hypothetical protein